MRRKYFVTVHEKYFFSLLVPICAPPCISSCNHAWQVRGSPIVKKKKIVKTILNGNLSQNAVVKSVCRMHLEKCTVTIEDKLFFGIVLSPTAPLLSDLLCLDWDDIYRVEKYFLHVYRGAF